MFVQQFGCEGSSIQHHLCVCVCVTEVNNSSIERLAKRLHVTKPMNDLNWVLTHTHSITGAVSCCCAADYSGMCAAPRFHACATLSVCIISYQNVLFVLISCCSVCVCLQITGVTIAVLQYAKMTLWENVNVTQIDLSFCLATHKHS